MSPYFRITLAVLVAVAASMAGFAAYAQEARTAVISFQKPTRYVTDETIPTDVVFRYNVYQGKRGQQKTLVGTITETGLTINSGLQPGETCWQVTAVANGVESAPSNEGCKTFAWPATNTVTITVT